MKIIDVGGVSYGPGEAIELRKELIRARDKALKDNDFEGAVLLSHAVALIHGLGGSVWGDDWFKSVGIPEATEHVK